MLRRKLSSVTRAVMLTCEKVKKVKIKTLFLLNGHLNKKFNESRISRISSWKAKQRTDKKMK